MNYLTILTPTYNRAAHLPKLYESLKKQTCQEFEWLLVDDGSDDQTEALAAEWKEEQQISFRYIRKENGGKHTALNTGLAEIASELTFIVDSDDWLLEAAVEKILSYHEKYKSRKDLCGYSFLRFYPDGTVNEAFFSQNEQIDTYVNVRINGHIAGDKAEVFFTEILRQYPFPVFKNEKFLPEDLVWVKMSGPWKMVHVNECIYISEYLEGGLTRSGRKMKLCSPRGMMARSIVYLEDPAVNLKTKFKMALLYNIYRQEAERMGTVSGQMDSCWLIRICRFPAICIYERWKKKYI